MNLNLLKNLLEKYDILTEYPYLRNPKLISKYIENNLAKKNILIFGEGLHSYEIINNLKNKSMIKGIIINPEKDIFFKSYKFEFPQFNIKEIKKINYDYIILPGYWNKNNKKFFCDKYGLDHKKLLDIYSKNEIIEENIKKVTKKILNFKFSNKKKLLLILRNERRDLITSNSEVLKDYFSLTKVYLSNYKDENNQFFENELICKNEFIFLEKLLEIHHFDIIVFFNCGQGDNAIAEYIRTKHSVSSKFVHINCEACLNYLFDISDKKLIVHLFNNNKEFFEINKYCENSLIRNADGFITNINGKFYNEIIKNIAKKSLIAFNFFTKKHFSYKEKKLENKISLVYTGSIFFKNPNNNFVMKALNFYNFFKNITNHNPDISIHVYNFQSINLENNLERVYLHQRVPHSEIPKTIENYDFGLFWFNIDEEIKKIYAMDFQSSVNGRFISYVAAGIPIIINDKLTLLSKIVKENEIGIIINNDDAKNLENIIRSYNYCQMKKKMKEFQVKFIKQNYEQRLKNFLIDITKDEDD